MQHGFALLCVNEWHPSEEIWSKVIKVKKISKDLITLILLSGDGFFLPPLAFPTSGYQSTHKYRVIRLGKLGRKDGKAETIPVVKDPVIFAGGNVSLTRIFQLILRS